MIKKIFFKNIVFSNLNHSDFNKIINKKGYFTFPSGPGLASINSSKDYLFSLQKSDLVFFDSGLFVILLKIFKGINVNKFSGYKFIELFLKYLKKNNKKIILCIDPNKNFSNSNKNYLKKIGVKNLINFVAPKYNPTKIRDAELVKLANKIKPHFILNNIGGGTQEILGLYLKQNIKFKTTILCTGGAISFFTGDQAPINSLIDKLYLGWLVRLIFNPFIFFKRYLIALRLIPLVLFNKVEIKND